MAHFTPAALDHFARCHGVASFDRLVQLGLTRDNVHALQQVGNLAPVLKGVYRMPAVPFDEMARCAAVCAAHPEAAIAGPTAGRIWQFRKLPPDRRVHIIASPHSQPTIESWVVPYRTAAIRDDDIVCRDDGIRLTSRARTALDLSRMVSDSTLLSIIEQAARDGQLTDDGLRDVAVDRRRDLGASAIGWEVTRVIASQLGPELPNTVALLSREYRRRRTHHNLR